MAFDAYEAACAADQRNLDAKEKTESTTTPRRSRRRSVLQGIKENYQAGEQWERGTGVLGVIYFLRTGGRDSWWRRWWDA